MGHELFYTRVVQPCAVVSCSLSCSVVITVLLFPDIIRGKIFMQIVAFISLCDCMGNWPYFLNYYPGNGTALCSFEGFCNLFFFPVSWILTTFLTKLFRDLAITSKITIKQWTIAVGSAGIPLLFTLLMLTVNTYGSLADDQHLEPCVYGGNPETGYIWHLATYDILLYLCLGVMLFLLGEVLWLEYSGRIKASSGMYAFLKRVLILYPLALFVCWVPHAVCITVPSCYGNFQKEAYVDAFKILHGGCVALIFYSVSGEARQKWCDLLKKLFRQSETPPPSSLWDPDQSIGDSVNLSSQTITRLPNDTNLTMILLRESNIFDELRGSRIALGTPHIHGGIQVIPPPYRAPILNSSFS
jgi:hypothetical protein